MLYIESDNYWRIIGPTEPERQEHNTGGEMALWTSADQGQTWAKARTMMRNSPYNHTYARCP